VEKLKIKCPKLSLQPKNQTGFSLVESMIFGTVLAISFSAYMQMTQTQRKNVDELQATIGRIDLEKSIINALSDGAVCSFILSDATQALTATPPNRSIDTFNSTSVTEDSPLVINVKNLLASPTSPSIAKVGESASALMSKLKISSMKFIIKPNQPPDIFLGDFQIDFDQIPGMRKLNAIVVKNIQIATDGASPLEAKKIIGCSGSGEPRAQRLSFAISPTDTKNEFTWTVPIGVRKAFVTMAGGGGSGLGWRMTSHLQTGNSGGYVFSHPIKVTPGDVVTVTVGKGGKGYRPINTFVPAASGPPDYIYTNPTEDDGLGGYPGGSTKLISKAQGLLLECAGGSGADANGIDDFTGGLVAGNIQGAVSSSGSPKYSSPHRAAEGPYASARGPGSCGPGPSANKYGQGNGGIYLWGIISGSYAGGMTPFGYGAGGAISVSGCYISASLTGTCIFPQDGRDGVVFI
jgi:hypothetical protein